MKCKWTIYNMLFVATTIIFFTRCTEAVIDDCDVWMSISLPEKYFNSVTVSNRTPLVYLTTENGVVLGQYELQNGVENKLCNIIPQEKINFTMVTMHKYPNDIIAYKLTTFLDVQSSEISIINEPPATCESKIILLGGSDINSFDPLHIGESNGVDEALELTIPTTNGTDQYYASYRDESESTKRYLWVDSLTCDSRDTFIVPNAKTIDQPVIIKYPENRSVWETIHGRSSTRDWDFTGIKFTFYALSKPETLTYIPFELFDQFKITTALRIDNLWYHKSIISDNIDTLFTNPELAIVSTLGNTQNFNIETEGDFEYFSITLDNSKSISDLFIEWKIHGKADGNISQELPRILNLIDEKLADIEPEQLKVKSTKIENYFNSLNYSTFIEHKLGTYIPYDSDLVPYYEGLTKDEE